MALGNSDNELQLVERMQQGDHAAMREAYDRYAPYMASVCSRYVSDPDDVKDVLQEAFVRIFRNIASFKPKGGAGLKAWMRTIVVNEALRWIERTSRPNFMDRVDDMPELPDEEPDTGPVPYDALLEMIQQLEPGHRAVLNLFVFEERSHREIAQMLGITENTSASHFHRAKKKLAKLIKEYLKTTI